MFLPIRAWCNSMLVQRKQKVVLLAVAVNGQIDESVGISPLVVVPADNLVKVFVQEDAGGGIDD